MVTASCLPLTSRGDKTPEDKILLRASEYSRPYASISSRLPADQNQVQQIAERYGALTRLRKVARQTINADFDPTDEQTSDERSDAESSSSLPKVDASEPLDDEDVARGTSTSVWSL